MIRHFTLVFTLLLGSLLGAQDRGAFLGVAGGPNGRYSLDFGFVLATSGASAWGVTMGGTSRTERTADLLPAGYTTTQAPGTYNITPESTGYRLGLYQDIGRAWGGIGVENVTEVTRTYTVHADKTWTANPENKTSSVGAYVQAGLKVTAWASVYAGYGTKSKAVAGIAIHF
jgi:hypothetical protein